MNWLYYLGACTLVILCFVIVIWIWWVTENIFDFLNTRKHYINHIDNFNNNVKIDNMWHKEINKRLKKIENHKEE